MLGYSALDMVQHYARIPEVDIQEAHHRANWPTGCMLVHAMAQCEAPMIQGLMPADVISSLGPGTPSLVNE